ncbi:hypothetical protein B0H13DRAFT_2529652 [Mycena leptocephala]|nr:hypothetical protein B0H13DRAFT_2529652 [Mycena leptocephala]
MIRPRRYLLSSSKGRPKSTLSRYTDIPISQHHIQPTEVHEGGVLSDGGEGMRWLAEELAGGSGVSGGTRREIEGGVGLGGVVNGVVEITRKSKNSNCHGEERRRAGEEEEREDEVGGWAGEGITVLAPEHLRSITQAVPDREKQQEGTEERKTHHLERVCEPTWCRRDVGSEIVVEERKKRADPRLPHYDIAKKGISRQHDMQRRVFAEADGSLGERSPSNSFNSWSIAMGLAPKDALSWRGSTDTGFGPNKEKEKLWRKRRNRIPSTDVPMPPGALDIVRENVQWLTPVAMVGKVQAAFPAVTAAQIHRAWMEMSEVFWRRDDQQLPSTKMLLEELTDDVDIFTPEAVPKGVEILCWGMKKIAAPLKGKVVEIHCGISKMPSPLAFKRAKGVKKPLEKLHQK